MDGVSIRRSQAPPETGVGPQGEQAENKHSPVLSIPEGRAWGPGKVGLWEQRAHLLGTPTLLLFLRRGEGRGVEGQGPGPPALAQPQASQGAGLRSAGPGVCLQDPSASRLGGEPTGGRAVSAFILKHPPQHGRDLSPHPPASPSLPRRASSCGAQAGVRGPQCVQRRLAGLRATVGEPGHLGGQESEAPTWWAGDGAWAGVVTTALVH